MKLKHYFASLGLAFILGLSFLPSFVMATGEDEPGSSDQENKDDNQEPGNSEGNEGDNNGEDQKPDPDDSGDSSDDDSHNSFIGGGMNSDNEESQAQAPSAPSTTKPTTPTTPIPTIPKPTLPSIVPGLSSSQISSSSRPQGTNSSSASLTTESTDEVPAEADDAEQNLSLLPTAPSSNLAPGSVETPNTGSSEPVSINIAAIALLIVAGVTIMSAGVFVAIMQKAANRDQ